MTDRHSDYRDVHVSSRARRGTEKHERSLGSQTRRLTRRQRQEAARERKRERQKERDAMGHVAVESTEQISNEPITQVTMGPQQVPNEVMLPVVETTQSSTTRFLGFLSRLPETVMGFLRGIEFFAPGGPEDIENALMEKEHSGNPASMNEPGGETAVFRRSKEASH